MAGPSSAREHLAHLTSFAPRLARGIWAGGIGLALGLVVTVAVVISTHRLYRSDAVLVYERGIRAASLSEEGEPIRLVGSRLRDTILSRQRLEVLIKELKLYPGLVDRRGMVEAVDEMIKHLTIKDREGYTFTVAYDADSRDQAQSVLQRILNDVVDQDRRRKSKDAEEAKRFLDVERKRAEDDLKTKEGALSTFLSSHPQLATEMGGGSASAGGLLRAADRERSAAPAGDTSSLELQAAQLEENLAAAGAHPAARPGAGPMLDPGLSAARTRAELELQSAQKDLADKETHLTNEHPDVKQALRRVAVAEAALRRAEANVASWHPPVAAVSDTPAAAEPEDTARVAALRRALTAVRQQISMVRGRSAPRVEVPKGVDTLVKIDTEWTRLNRDVSEARERQSQLESKQFQAEIALTLAAGGQGGQFVIADPPFKPMRPIAGRRFKVAAVGVAGSFVLAIIVIGLFAALDDRLYALRDVEGLLDGGIVVVIPSPPRKITAKGG